MELYKQIIDEQIERIQNQQSIQFEISVLQDLKRMAELGCFTVYTSAPNDVEIRLSDCGKVVTAECKVPRMTWSGEITVLQLREEIRILKEKIVELSNQ